MALGQFFAELGGSCASPRNRAHWDTNSFQRGLLDTIHRCLGGDGSHLRGPLPVVLHQQHAHADKPSIADVGPRIDDGARSQFLELLVLPVAAALEGLRGHAKQHRVRLVFPTMKSLVEARSAMTLVGDSGSDDSGIGLSCFGMTGSCIDEADSVAFLVDPYFVTPTDRNPALEKPRRRAGGGRVRVLSAHTSG